MNCVLKYKLEEGATPPRYQTEGSVGFDLCAIKEGCVVSKGQQIVDTGVAFQVPEGLELQIRPRSGLAAKYGITVLNSPGTIDQDYRGAVKIILFNAGDWTYHWEKGDRIAQAVLSPVIRGSLVEGELSETERGAGGFGSTGVK